MAKLNRKSIEDKMLGAEPKDIDFTKQPEELRHARRYYAYYFSPDHGLKWAKKWAKDNKDKELLKALNTMRKGMFIASLGNYARMMNRGCKLGPEQMSWFQEKRDETIKIAERRPMNTKTEKQKEVDAARRAHKNMKKLEKAHEELDALFWNMIENRRKPKFNAKSFKVRHSLSDAELKTLCDDFKGMVDELQELVFKKTSDLKEAYSHIKNHKGYYALVSEVYNSLVFESTSRKAKRAARKPKPVSVEKMFRGIRFQAEDAEMKLRSLPVTDIHKASRVYVVSSKYKDMIVYQAKEGGFEAKGASLTNVEFVKKKKLRKPDEQIAEFMKKTVRTRMKYFNEIRTKEGETSARFADHYIILKIDK